MISIALSQRLLSHLQRIVRRFSGGVVMTFVQRIHGLAAWLSISCLYQQNQQSQSGPFKGLGSQLVGIGYDC